MILVILVILVMLVILIMVVILGNNVSNVLVTDVFVFRNNDLL